MDGHLTMACPAPCLAPLQAYGKVLAGKSNSISRKDFICG
jgi:hypothetical protein